jgi:DNA (cytosine-5)-methyltransferase 1
VEWKTEVSKPAYVVPSMLDVQKIKGTNGFNTVSLFSGCGGSCLGFEMAGYKPLFASEFIPEAQTTYRLNHDDVHLDGRDIRLLQPQDIFDAIGTDQIDVLEGSPPCSSFSQSGKGDKGWGDVSLYSDKKQRTDDLFFEFIRIVKGTQPKVFVAENVKGLVTGSGKGYFKMILQSMKDAGYQVQAQLLDASLLGVPQKRNRIIFIGVRNDLNLQPVFPKPFDYQYSIGEVITDNPSYIDDETKEPIDFTANAIYEAYMNLKEGTGCLRKYYNLVRPSMSQPVPTITATGGLRGAAAVKHPIYPRAFNLEEVRLLSGFPADFQLTGSFKQRYERIGRAVPPLMMKAIAETICNEILTK